MPLIPLMAVSQNRILLDRRGKNRNSAVAVHANMRICLNKISCEDAFFNSNYACICPGHGRATPLASIDEIAT